MDKKEKKGYMTLEATMVFPVVLGGIILILYLGFYLYNASMIKQIAIVSALRGSQVTGISVKETENLVKKQVEELSDKKFLLKKEMEQKIVVSLTKVKVQINMEMETLAMQGVSLPNVFWNLETNAEAARINPVSIIRGVRIINEHKISE